MLLHAQPHDEATRTIAMIEIRKGQTSEKLTRTEFSTRFRASFSDPSYASEVFSIDRLEQIAWQAYTEGRKAPYTQKSRA